MHRKCTLPTSVCNHLVTARYLRRTVVLTKTGRPTIENLSGRQLSAEVTATLHTGSGRQELTDILSSESDAGQDPGPSKRRRGKTTAASASGSPPSRRWVDDDLTEDEVLRFTWKDQSQPQAERDLSPVTCFELFF